MFEKLPNRQDKYKDVTQIMLLLMLGLIITYKMNVVSNACIQEIVTENKTDEMNILVGKYSQLGKRYEKIKAGFSPFLFIMLST